MREAPTAIAAAAIMVIIAAWWMLRQLRPCRESACRYGSADTGIRVLPAELRRVRPHLGRS